MSPTRAAAQGKPRSVNRYGVNGGPGVRLRVRLRSHGYVCGQIGEELLGEQVKVGNVHKPGDLVRVFRKAVDKGEELTVYAIRLGDERNDDELDVRMLPVNGLRRREDGVRGLLALPKKAVGHGHERVYLGR